ncbi:IS3-like element ISBlo10 family transposase [Bifidobacterium longum]|uniref:IS3-like element ISBlo10 family transposase n=1 Tax=Bifidobacterium longum TaxID=216816 RepID=UPI002860E3F7|nr:IS3-like element ISBlo10 family transposase [Bifidobacterium longum]MDR5620113.1 IS3-like element ISBlo10 family transposase [Bifidobacterium longum]
MAKGTRYTPEFKAKAVRLLTESRGSYSSETKAIEQVAKDPGVAPETLRRWRNKTDATVAAETKRSAEDAMAELKSLRAENAELRRANEILTTASGFFRGTARPDTALMVAYIDEFKDRFRVGPICRVLAASLDCGSVTPRGYRMFRSRPVSRMAARHEALARDILEIHADFFMAVYGYRKTRAQLLARGWDPAEIGRDQVMNVMRESGIRGVRRGRTPVTTKPAKGTGGRPDLVERGFEAEAPNRLHVADITYVRMANGSFGYTAFAADVFARRIVGWACATTMDTRELPLQALEQAISWAASHGGADGLVHHSDHGAQYISLVYTTRVGEFGMLPSTGTVGDSYDNAMAESADGAYRTELVWRRKPFQDLRDLELATFRWVSWRGLEASAPVLGLQDTGTDRNRVLCKPSGASRPTIRAEQKSGHIRGRVGEKDVPKR